jgi:hypothetical protein
VLLLSPYTAYHGAMPETISDGGEEAAGLHVAFPPLLRIAQRNSNQRVAPLQIVPRGEATNFSACHAWRHLDPLFSTTSLRSSAPFEVVGDLAALRFRTLREPGGCRFRDLDW